MEKRTVIAIALSILVLMTWSALMPKPQPIVNKAVVNTEGTQQKVFVQKPEPPICKLEAPKEPPLKYSQAKFDVSFDEPKAAINEVVFKLHQNHLFKLGLGLFLDDPTLNFKNESCLPEAVTFVHKDQNKKIVKRFIFSKSNYDIWLEINYQNLSSSPIKINSPLVLGVLDFSPANIHARNQDVAISTKEKAQHLSGRKDFQAQQLNFVGLRDRYFCAILDPGADGFSGFIKKFNNVESEVGLNYQEITLLPGSQIGQKYHIYLGPQDLKTLNSINPNWAIIINYGTFDFISQILLQLLELLYRLVHNWGWAIIILSILVYFALYPLTLKQMRSMKGMQAIQPKIEELRKAYKDNPQKLNKEIMELYKEHKVNPLGGCLPLLLQMPIFFALYQALLRSIVLKGASFLWIKDLSEPDRLFTLPKDLPVIGNEINILPIVMAIEMFVQQKFSMASTSSSSAEQQKMMMFLMPLLFGFIFYKMPSGLVLYWFINSTLMLIYQIRISRAK